MAYTSCEDATLPTTSTKTVHSKFRPRSRERCKRADDSRSRSMIVLQTHLLLMLLAIATYIHKSKHLHPQIVNVDAAEQHEPRTQDRPNQVPAVPMVFR